LQHLQRQLETRGQWETRYVLLLWLSLVCRIPFDLTRLDSSDAATVRLSVCVRHVTIQTLAENLISLGKSLLSATGKEREGSGELLARLLTRLLLLRC
jgi:hypothetical protein